jgi:hypothetical protein
MESRQPAAVQRQGTQVQERNSIGTSLEMETSYVLWEFNTYHVMKYNKNGLDIHIR